MRGQFAVAALFRVRCDRGHVAIQTGMRCYCGAPLTFDYELDRVKLNEHDRSMWRYIDLLPVRTPKAIVTLGEGGTPLFPSRLEQHSGLLIKDESRNPSGSHKDRALAVATTHAVERGAKPIVIASAGGAALACVTYAARAGIPAFVVVPAGIAAERLAPIAVRGAQIFEFDGTLDEAVDAVDRACEETGAYQCSTARRLNPYQAEGVKTIAYEIVDTLGNSPDWVVVPTGGGGTLAAMWRGFQEAHALGWADKLPRMVAVQSATHPVLAIALDRGVATEDAYRALRLSDDRPTILNKLAHQLPPDGWYALDALRVSNGLAVNVSDAEAIDAVRELATTDGIYAEPSAAVAVVAARRLRSDGIIAREALCVAVITGSGLRETTTLLPYVTVLRRRLDPVGFAVTLTRASKGS